jgi:hypothetical protein
MEVEEGRVHGDPKLSKDDSNTHTRPSSKVEVIEP